MSGTPNFTMPSEPGALDQTRPGGMGDNGETWDPVQKRWIPQSQMPAQRTDEVNQSDPSRVAGANGGSDPYHPANAAGFSVSGGEGYQEGPGLGRHQTDDAYGGYDGTYVPGPNGVPVLDRSQSGMNSDVNRFRTMAGGAENRESVKTNYGIANQYADLGNESRGGQVDAMNMAKDTALNGDQVSQHLGRNMLQQGADAQRAAALSKRGGAMAGMSALRQQGAGLAGYMQRGNQTLAAQRASDMAAGRNEYMGIATGIRSGDATAQGLNQGQTISQGDNDLAQRGANDAMESGYEGMAFGTLSAQQKADLKRKAIDSGTYHNDLNVDTASKAEGAKNIVSYMDNASKMGSSAVNVSDYRAKEPASIVQWATEKRRS